MAGADHRGAHSIGEIAGGLAGDVQDLVRGELSLARAEFDQKLHGLVIAAVSIIGGALVAFAGLVVVLEGGRPSSASGCPLGRRCSSLAWSSFSSAGSSAAPVSPGCR